MRRIKRKLGSEDRGIEATSLHGFGRHSFDGGRRAWVNQVFEVEIEEHLVLLDRPTYRPAHVVVPLPPLGTGRVEEVSRIESVILVVVVGGAVELVRTGFTDEVENIATAAVHCRGVLSYHL